MQQVKFVNSLKLRIAYGTTGNDVVDGGRRYNLLAAVQVLLFMILTALIPLLFWATLLLLLETRA
jgi:hypothetical protein